MAPINNDIYCSSCKTDNLGYKSCVKVLQQLIDNTYYPSGCRIVLDRHNCLRNHEQLIDTSRWDISKVYNWTDELDSDSE
jgi:hypothetical protein